MSREKCHVKAGQTVQIIAGADKGKTGKVLIVNKDRQRAVVEGLNLCTKHQKPTQDVPEGSIIEREAAVHVSNLKVVE